MKHIFFIPLMLSIIALSCSADKIEKIPSSEDVLNADKISGSKIYHNPVSADKPFKDDEAAKMSFEELAHDFGTIKEGEVVQHIFKFKNTGKAPLVITSATGTCGCTVPLWPKEPIMPGKNGDIKVSFDSAGKSGTEEKEIYIIANTIPNKTTLRISSMVISKP